MSIFNRKSPEKNSAPATETKSEMKLVGNFKVESKDKKGLEALLLSGNEITVLVSPETGKIILGTPEDLAMDPEIPFGNEMMQYSYSITEISKVGNNNIPKGELHLANPKSATLIEQATGMTEPNARRIIEGKIKEHLALLVDTPAQIKNPS